jgi:hypothetical protein
VAFRNPLIIKNVGIAEREKILIIPVEEVPKLLMLIILNKPTTAPSKNRPDVI